ncbi:MAG: hypothetical protein Q4E65_09295, partial [Clostridia bacterium]|nr:hypothetical protein [Clostridia bacterium]
MRKRLIAVFAVLLACLLLLGACAQEPETPAQTPAEDTAALAAAPAAENAEPLPPTPTPTDKLPEGYITGTVVCLYKNAIVVNVSNTTFVFMLTLHPDVDAQPGDIVTVHYVGDTALSPEAVSVIKQSAKPPVPAVSGIVTKHDRENYNLFLQTVTGNRYIFALTEDTYYDGDEEAGGPNEGDTVKLTYTGDLLDIPIVTDIQTLSIADEGPLANRTIRGEVTAYNASSITILAPDGYSYTFPITDRTIIEGRYELTVGSTVRITFDGYAARHPNAKIIDVLAPKYVPTARPTYATPLPTIFATACKSPSPTPTHTATPIPTVIAPTPTLTPWPTAIAP